MSKDTQEQHWASQFLEPENSGTSVYGQHQADALTPMTCMLALSTAFLALFQMMQ